MNLNKTCQLNKTWTPNLADIEFGKIAVFWYWPNLKLAICICTCDAEEGGRDHMIPTIPWHSKTKKCEYKVNGQFLAIGEIGVPVRDFCNECHYVRFDNIKMKI